jgi:hypothetical protein
MRTTFRHDTAGDYDDLVGISDGGQAVSNRDDRASLHQALQGFNYQLLGFAVERRCWFIQQENRIVADHHACDTDALPLATGKGRSAFAHHGVVALCHLGDEFMGVGQLSRLDNFFP